MTFNTNQQLDGDKITVTLKADGSAPWIVVHASSAEEAHELLGATYSGGQSLAEHAAAASAVLTNSWSEEKRRQGNPNAAVETVAQGVGGQVVSTQPATTATSDFPATYTCAHGERVHRKDPGGKWEAMFCPTAKGTPGQCEPLWKDKKTGQFG